MQVDEDLRDIDQIAAAVRAALAEVVITQLRVSHPADDDGIWWFALPGRDDDIQLESTTGMCPFLVETDARSGAAARCADSVNAAVAMVVAHLAAPLAER